MLPCIGDASFSNKATIKDDEPRRLVVEHMFQTHAHRGRNGHEPVSSAIRIGQT